MSVIETPREEIAQPALWKNLFPPRLIQMNNTNVFVVDDDISICRIVHRMLSDEQYKVETSQSVADALAAVEQTSFDVYVIDYKLPDGSGFDVAERIRSKWGATPIIFISGYDPSAVALRAEELRISDFLEKPDWLFQGEYPELSPGDPPFSPIMSRPTRT